MSSYIIRNSLLFHNIIGIYALLNHGGTRYMHMYEKMHALVEDCVASRDYSQDDNEVDFKEKKRHYISMIKAMAASREAVDFDLMEDEKKKTYKDIYRAIDGLERNITSRYFLWVVRRFQYTRYE